MQQQETAQTIIITFVFLFQIIFAQNSFKVTGQDISVDIQRSPCSCFPFDSKICIEKQLDYCLVDWIKWFMEYSSQSESISNNTESFFCLPFLQVSFIVMTNIWKCFIDFILIYFCEISLTFKGLDKIITTRINLPIFK